MTGPSLESSRGIGSEGFGEQIFGCVVVSGEPEREREVGLLQEVDDVVEAVLGVKVTMMAVFAEQGARCVAVEDGVAVIEQRVDRVGVNQLGSSRVSPCRLLVCSVRP